MENNYQLSRIHNYINGLMSKEDMYALEREALEDPFLQDAIDGYKLQNGVDAKQLSLLQKRLTTRIEEQQQERSNRFGSWQRLTVGMAAGVMFLTVCTLVLIRFLPQQKALDAKEIILSEYLYDYFVTPMNTVSNIVPKGGWEKLHEQLIQHYSNPHTYEGTLTVSFDVGDDKKPKNIKIEGIGYIYDEELSDILRNRVKWEGNKALFTIDISKINP